jgi:hypothetical protein
VLANLNPDAQHCQAVSKIIVDFLERRDDPTLFDKLVKLLQVLVAAPDQLSRTLFHASASPERVIERLDFNGHFEAYRQIITVCVDLLAVSRPPQELAFAVMICNSNFDSGDDEVPFFKSCYIRIQKSSKNAKKAQLRRIVALSFAVHVGSLLEHVVLEFDSLLAAFRGEFTVPVLHMFAYLAQSRANIVRFAEVFHVLPPAIVRYPKTFSRMASHYFRHPGASPKQLEHVLAESLKSQLGLAWTYCDGLAPSAAQKVFELAKSKHDELAMKVLFRPEIFASALSETCQLVLSGVKAHRFMSSLLVPHNLKYVLQAVDALLKGIFACFHSVRLPELLCLLLYYLDVVPRAVNQHCVTVDNFDFNALYLLGFYLLVSPEVSHHRLGVRILRTTYNLFGKATNGESPAYGLLLEKGAELQKTPFLHNAGEITGLNKTQQIDHVFEERDTVYHLCILFNNLVHSRAGFAQAARMFLPQIKRRGNGISALLCAGEVAPEVDFSSLERDEFQVAALVSGPPASRSSILERLLNSKVDSKTQIEAVHLLLQSLGDVTEDFFAKGLAGLMRLIGAVHGSPLSDVGIVFMHSVQLALTHIKSPDPASLAPYLEVLRTTAIRQAKDLFAVGEVQPTVCLLFSTLCQLLGRTQGLLGADKIASEIAGITSLVVYVTLDLALQALMSLCDDLRHTYPNQMGQFLDAILLNSLDRIFIAAALARRLD